MTTNRKTGRKQLATLLEAKLVGTGLPLASFYNYRKYNITEHPTGFVTSAGTEDNSPNQNVENVMFIYSIHTIVPYSDPDGTYNEDDAEDTLDDVEDIIRDTLRDNRTASGYWSHIIYAGRTNSEEVDFGTTEGFEYRHEIYTVRAQVEGG